MFRSSFKSSPSTKFSFSPIKTPITSTPSFRAITTKTALPNETIIKQVQEGGFKKVKLNVVDIDGVLRGKYVSVDKFISSLKSGVGFCSVIFGWDVQDKCYDNSKFAGWHTGYPDVTAVIDTRTYRNIPWEANTPFFLMDFNDVNGNPLAVCPRKLLRGVLAQVEKEVNAVAIVGPELEFYNYNESNSSLIQKSYSTMDHLTPGMFGYSSLRTGQNYEYFQKIFNELLAFGVEVEGLHTETGPGVLEVAIGCDEALIAADKAVLFKYGIKLIGSKMNIYPCFMAKPHKNLPGNSGHLHQSLHNKEDMKNIFYDANDKNRMSTLFKQFVAGQLHCMPHIMPMYCPTVNSYKRLVEGYWAPVQPTWGVENRTTSLRVIPGSSKNTRLETRIPGADANPYLSIAAAIASGLYGIRHKLELGGDIVGTLEITDDNRLPRNLWEATNKMKSSPIANELFGEEFTDHFIRTREWEWREFQTSITNWELERYSEIF